MKACVSSWGYRKWFAEGKCDLMSFLKEVKRLKADGLEIFAQHVDASRYEEHVREVARAARSRKLEISALIVGNDFAAPSIADRAEHVEKMKRAIRAAAAAKIKRLNVFTGYHRPGEDPQMEVARVVDCYREVCPAAEKKRIRLCLENHSSVCKDIDELLWLFRAVGSRALCSNPDPSNFCSNYPNRSDAEREIIYTSTEKFVRNAANAHLKIRDFTRSGEHAHVDLKRLAGIFKAARYTGPVVLEYHGPDDPVKPNQKGLRLLRKYFR